MASNTKSYFHTRSNSLPSGPHPLVSQIDEHLCRLRETEAISSSITNNISGPADLYDLVNNLLVLPLTQQALGQACNEKQVDEVLDRSLGLMDVCCTIKDALLKIKEDTQGIQSILRRGRGDESRINNQIREYLSSRKMAIRAIQKSFIDLKSTSPPLKQDTMAAVSMLREVEGVTLIIFESLLSYISGTKTQSNPRGWSLVSKPMHSKSRACDEEAAEVSEFKKVCATFYSLIRNSSRKSSNKNSEDAQNELVNLQSSIQDLEEGLECLLRSLIKTRVFLLNILNH